MPLRLTARRMTWIPLPFTRATWPKPMRRPAWRPTPVVSTVSPWRAMTGWAPRGGERPELLYVRSICAAKLGRYAEALGNIQEAMKLKPAKMGSFFFRTAQIYAMAGDRGKAYSYAQQAIQKGYSREELRHDRAFRDFQDDPRFRAILESSDR